MTFTHPRILGGGGGLHDATAAGSSPHPNIRPPL